MLQRLTGNRFKFFRDLVILAGGQVVSKLLGFLAFAWLARVLAPASYGAVEYVVGLAAFFAIVVEGGLGIVGTRRTGTDDRQMGLLAFQIPVARLLLAIASVPLMIGVAVWTSHKAVPPQLILLFAASLLTVPWRQQWLFQATGRMSIVANADIVRMAVFAAIVGLAVHATRDVRMVGWAEVAGVTTMTLYCLVLQRRSVVPVAPEIRFAGFGALMKEGAAVGSTNFVWALTQGAPLFLVSGILGGVSTAWFAGAARIVGSIIHFSSLYHFNLYPAVSRAHAENDDTLGQLLERSMRITAWGGVLVALILTLFAFPLVRLTLGVKLRDAAPVLQILAWAIPIALWSGHSRWALAAAGAQRSVLMAQLTGLLATVATGVAAGRFLGVIGYAVGTIAGSLTVWTVSHHLAVSRRCHPPPLRPALLPLALAGVAIAFARSFGFDVPQTVLATLAYAILAPVLDRGLLRDIRGLAAMHHPRRGEVRDAGAGT